jgi:hypothetical protein
VPAVADFHGLPPARVPGKKGRPRLRGDRLPSLAGIAAADTFAQVAVTRYGNAETVRAAAVTCLWYSVFGTRQVQVVLHLRARHSAWDTIVSVNGEPGCPDRENMIASALA